MPPGPPHASRAPTCCLLGNSGNHQAAADLQHLSACPISTSNVLVVCVCIQPPLCTASVLIVALGCTVYTAKQASSRLQCRQVCGPCTLREAGHCQLHLHVMLSQPCCRAPLGTAPACGTPNLSSAASSLVVWWCSDARAVPVRWCRARLCSAPSAAALSSWRRASRAWTPSSCRPSAAPPPCCASSAGDRPTSCAVHALNAGAQSEPRVTRAAVGRCSDHPGRVFIAWWHGGPGIRVSVVVVAAVARMQQTWQEAAPPKCTDTQWVRVKGV
jgi:hypothetical protein